MNYYISVIKKYVDFSGRARRAEYWYFYLFTIIFLIVAMILDSILGLKIGGSNIGFIYLIYALFIIIPSIAVAVRRLHDIGKSGWMLLISLIPFIGGIWLLVLMVRDSEMGDNKYGPNPKGVPAVASVAPVAEAPIETPVSTPETPPQA